MGCREGVALRFWERDSNSQRFSTPALPLTSACQTSEVLYKLIHRLLPPVCLDPNQLKQVSLSLDMKVQGAMPDGSTLSLSVDFEEPSTHGDDGPDS